ncbi:MAG: DUF4232 domain-containing protein, partial [Acidimicrobiales bacterium]
MHWKRSALAGLGLLIAGGALAACSPSTPSATTKPPNGGTTTIAPGSSSTTSVPATSSTIGSTTTSTIAQVTACSHGALAVKSTTSQGTTGTIYLGFTITNRGPAPCTLEGYPAIGLVPKSGSVTPQISHRGQGQIFSDKPSLVTLSVGAGH